MEKIFTRDGLNYEIFQILDWDIIKDIIEERKRNGGFSDKKTVEV